MIMPKAILDLASGDIVVSVVKRFRGLSEMIEGRVAVLV
jgi:hypothetical protein